MADDKIHVEGNVLKKVLKKILPKPVPKPYPSSQKVKTCDDPSDAILSVSSDVSMSPKQTEAQVHCGKATSLAKQNNPPKILSTSPIRQERGTPCQNHVIPTGVMMIDEEGLYGSKEYGNYAYHSHMVSLSQEAESVPREGFFTNLGEDGERKRATVVNLYIDLAERFMFSTDSVFRAVNIFDRYVSGNCLEEGKHMLVGITSLCIASKYEDRKNRGIHKVISASKLPYSPKDVSQMEMAILESLGFKLTLPTPLTFAWRFNIIGLEAFKGEQEFYASMNLFFLHVAMLSSKISSQRPSLIAASVFNLCANIANEDYRLDEGARHYFGDWKDGEMVWINKELTKLVQNHGNFDGNGEFLAVFEKFSSSGFRQVSTRVIAKLNRNILQL